MTVEERIKMLLGELQVQNAALVTQLEAAHKRIKKLEGPDERKPGD